MTAAAMHVQAMQPFLDGLGAVADQRPDAEIAAEMRAKLGATAADCTPKVRPLIPAGSACCALCTLRGDVLGARPCMRSTPSPGAQSDIRQLLSAPAGWTPVSARNDDACMDHMHAYHISETEPGGARDAGDKDVSL